MAVADCMGHSESIRRIILGAAPEDRSDWDEFWAYAAAGGGIMGEAAACVRRLMARQGCEDVVLAAALCAVLSYLWSGHASVSFGSLPSIFEAQSDFWASQTGADAWRGQITAQAMAERFAARKEAFVCRNADEARGKLLHEDAHRCVYATPRMARIAREVSSNLKRFFDKDEEIIGVSRQTIEERASFRDKSGEICKPHEAQTDAVMSFCKHRLTVIAGGPGTGKTSMVVCQILRIAFEDAHFEPQDVLLAAPTGKAAQRMQEAIRDVSPRLEDGALRAKFDALKAQTLHRALSLRSGLLSPYASGEKLTAKLVIVDEVSMIELPLAAQLLTAIDPKKTRLVLVGDPNQLPPVGTGEILSGFANCEDIAADDAEERMFYENMRNCAVTLTENFRAKNAPKIAEAQTAIAQGTFDASRICEMPKEVGDIRFSGIEYFCGMGQIDRVLDRWIETMRERYRQMAGECGESLDEAVGMLGNYGDSPEEKAVLERVFRLFDSEFRILSPVNAGVCGTKSLNRKMIARLMPGSKQDMPSGSIAMLTQNDYAINHFNGDTCIVLAMNRSGSKGEGAQAAAFPAIDGSGKISFEFFPLHSVKTSLEIAFAITVHKSQGSEYRRGLIALPPQKSPLLSRNMLYTAVSRTREGALLLADRAILEECARNARTFDPRLPYVR